MQKIKALTWDHPRGYNALAAASKLPEVLASGLQIEWDKQPLEGFESHPIADLCARYDLVVLDHPHIGEAVRGDCLQSLESVFGQAYVMELGRNSIGPSLRSYGFSSNHWALPLDAATQVMARRPDLLADAPTTWEQVQAISRVTGKVALSLAGPHAILNFLSVCASFGDAPAESDPERLVSESVGRDAYELLSDFASRSPASVRDKNPIGILAHMASSDDVVLCPLVFGYVNYAAPKSGSVVAFSNAPRKESGSRPGSTLGGTGIGITKACVVGDALKQHLRWLMSETVQSRFIPSHEGQPSSRSAWHDQEVNRRWGDFYRDTADTIEQAYVRPRHHGYMVFQEQAAAFLRDAFQNRMSSAAVIAHIQDLYSKNRTAGSER